MAVTANQLTKRADGERKSYPVAASTNIYQGTLVYINASGYADDDTAAGVNEFAGVAISQADNSSGSNGDIEVEVWYEGGFELLGTAFTQANVGDKVYGVDNFTTSLSGTGNTYLGRMTRYTSATLSDVQIHDFVNPSDMTVTNLADDTELYFGDGSDAGFQWSTADASANAFVIFTDDTNQAVHITDKAARDSDWNLSNTTHPNVYIHSNTPPITDYLRIGDHDGTTAEIDVVGGTTLNLQIAGTTAVSVLSTGITLPAGQDLIFVGTTGQSEIHLTDNLADALSMKIIGGNDLIVFCTTDAAESVTINQNLVVGTKATGAGSTFVPFVPMGVHTTAVAPAGAIPITNYYSTLDSTAGATTATLANGAIIGQLKKIQMIVDNGDVVVTPANLANGTTLTFADAGDFAVLIFDGTDWVVIELGNSADGATAPVLA